MNFNSGGQACDTTSSGSASYTVQCLGGVIVGDGGIVLTDSECF